MKRLTLNEIRQVELQLLKEFKAFCEKNNIRFFLSNGTLLGAVKYKGFIPWDDDIDVLVPRDDYDKLVNLFQDNEQYRLYSYERNPSYFFPFAKFCDMTTQKEEKSINNGVILGLDIDVFPLDFWANDLPEAKREVRRINRNMFRLSLSKLKKADSLTPIKRCIKSIAMFFCKIRGSGYFVENIIKACDCGSPNSSLYVGCKSWCIYGEREIIPSGVFSDTVEVEFEGEKFLAPIGYDRYLRSLYGDYEQDPPQEEQKTHHRFVAYRLQR